VDAQRVVEPRAVSSGGAVPAAAASSVDLAAMMQEIRELRAAVSGGPDLISSVRESLVERARVESAVKRKAEARYVDVSPITLPKVARLNDPASQIFVQQHNGWAALLRRLVEAEELNRVVGDASDLVAACQEVAEQGEHLLSTLMVALEESPGVALHFGASKSGFLSSTLSQARLKVARKADALLLPHPFPGRGGSFAPSGGGVECFYCHRRGHTENECNKKKRAFEGATGRPAAASGAGASGGAGAGQR
jgi:hypothetical protein